MVVLLLVGVLCCTLLTLLLVAGLWGPNKRQIKGKHVMVTGGSSGIGLSVALEVAALGAKVTLVARNVERLKKAKEEVESVCPAVEGSDGGGSSRVQFLSVDLGGSQEHIAEAVQRAEATLGPIHMLVNCAGFARARVFEDIPHSIVKELMDVNFHGSFLLSQEVVRGMKARGDGGCIVFTSSQGGLLGLYGFTAYSAAKAALVKLAEALHMEVKPHGITVTVSYPPDTQTPGFHEENKTKPTETRLISEAGGLFTAEEVAKKLVEDALRGKFSSTVGLDGFMLTTLCAGMAPVTDLPSLIAQVFLSGIFRLVSVFYLWSFSRIIETEHNKRKATVVEGQDSAK